MADDDFDKLDDDFSSDFDVSDEQPSNMGAGANMEPGGDKSSIMSIVKIVVVLVVLGGGGYYGYTMMKAQPAATASTPAATPAPAQPTAQAPHPTAPAPEKVDFNEAYPSPTHEKVDNALSQSKTFEQVQKELQSSSNTTASKPQPIPPEVNAILDSISEEMTLNVNQIKNLENTIGTLSAAVEQLNKSISAMDNRVLSLTETVDTLSQELNHVKKVIVDEDLDLTQSGTVKFSNKQQTSARAAGASSYSVHAIIPGRAWLRSSSGQIITVTEGDKVGDFGTVAVIDAANGLVRTSSGVTFK